MSKFPLNHLLDFSFEESVRVRLNSYLGSNYNTNDFYNFGSQIFNDYNFQSILTTLNYVSCIKYSHPGLNSAVYFDHPVRVASMSVALMLPESISIDACNLALSHNIVETSSVNHIELENILGYEIFRAIKLLTVDRIQQYDLSYKDKYYEAISKSPKFVQIIKVLDKLDNIYTLGINTNSWVKNFYIFEIKKYILPLCYKLPEILYERLFSATNYIVNNPNYINEYPEYELLITK